MAVEGDTLPTPLPVATPSHEFANYGQYGYASYTKPQAVFYMLRELLGKETTRRILRTYYDRYRFRHVNEGALRWAAAEVTGRDLGWFFDRWLRSTATLDWGVASASTSETDDGSWRTTVRVRREGEAWMPVTLRVSGPEGTLRDVRVDTRERTATVEVVTGERPVAVELDPDRTLLDVDRSDNRRELSGG
jgi:aminopeptidase N